MKRRIYISLFYITFAMSSYIKINAYVLHSYCKQSKIFWEGASVKVRSEIKRNSFNELDSDLPVWFNFKYFIMSSSKTKSQKTSNNSTFLKLQNKKLEQLTATVCLLRKLSTFEGFFNYYINEIPFFKTEQLAYEYVSGIYKNLTGVDKFVNYFDFLVTKEKFVKC